MRKEEEKKEKKRKEVKVSERDKMFNSSAYFDF